WRLCTWCRTFWWPSCPPLAAASSTSLVFLPLRLAPSRRISPTSRQAPSSRWA
ncbi:unnamed protein product, partial [Ascophyllum nodosum]